METYECPYHKILLPYGESCQECLDDWENRPDADLMTGNERVAELEAMGTLTIPFEKVHKRIEELVGRPVWTHEMGTDGMKRLIEEARNRGCIPTEKINPEKMREIIELIPEGKRIIFPVPGEET